jgi:hypothetical protein
MSENEPVNRTLKGRMKRFLVRTRQRVPPGLRLVLGLFLICGGLVGFLPVLGFWMIPLGVAVAALDIKPIIRRWRNRRRD